MKFGFCQLGAQIKSPGTRPRPWPSLTNPPNPNTHTQEEHGPDCEGSEELTAAQAILDEVEPMLEV